MARSRTLTQADLSPLEHAWERIVSFDTASAVVRACRSVRLLRAVSAQHFADALGGVLHEAINQAVIPEHKDATLHLRVGPELFSAFVARRCTGERAVVMAQPDGGAVDASMTMFHGHEAITRANRSAALRRRVKNQKTIMIPFTITRAARASRSGDS